MADDKISEVEEQLTDQSTSFCPDLKDEIYMSDDEPDLLNEAVEFENDKMHVNTKRLQNLVQQSHQRVS